MRASWNALTRVLANWPLDAEAEDPRVASSEVAVGEAWTETAARLGLLRLGWFESRQLARLTLAYPCERAIAKTIDRSWVVELGLGSTDRAGAATHPGVGTGRSGVRSGPIVTAPMEGAHDARAAVVHGEGLLVMAASSRELPPRSTMSELATLAAAVGRLRSLSDEARRAHRLAAQGRHVAAAGHDLRNELTRALLLAARGEQGDAEGVMASLRNARDLAQSSLTDCAGHGRTRVEALHLHALLVEEARAASASARVPRGAMPRLRVRCPSELRVLADAPTLGRAIRNLVINALEASAQRAPCGAGSSTGTVSVRATACPVDAAGFSVRVDVRDDGSGMSRSEVEGYLAPKAGWNAADAVGPSHGKPESTGLGTASLRHALEAGGIPLRVESAPDRGTTVTLVLRQPSPGPLELAIDPDVRRSRRWVAAGSKRPGRHRWALSGEDAVWPLLDRDHVHGVVHAPTNLEPGARSSVERACRRIGIVWSGMGGHD